MRFFLEADEAIEIYTDGSHTYDTHTMAYGWVVANPLAQATSARVVKTVNKQSTPAGATQMESRAIIDALSEYRYRGAPVVIYSDCQALVDLYRLYTTGVYSFEKFTASQAFLPGDGERFLELASSMTFEIRWVKAHKDSFLNLVVDQMCRMVTREGASEEEGVRFATTALEAREAVVWGKLKHVGQSGPTFYNGYYRVSA